MAETSPVRLKTTAETLAAPPTLSVVVPTRNEAGNVRALVEQLHSVLDGTPAEIVFVDDSDDDTPSVIGALAAGDPDGVRLVHRPAGARDGGLGGAVVAGLNAARAPWVVVMDGDLQHPPATVPDLLAAGRARTAEAVVASRYRGSGEAAGLSGWFRRLVSRASGTAAKLLFPVRLRAVTDPMSGFFAVRRDAVRTGELHPDGYKILLEVLVRNRLDRITEIPYRFQPRHAGESKASLREGLRYGRHLAGLRLATLRHPRSAGGRLLGFALAGAAGTGVNSAALWALGERAGLPYLIAAFLAVQVAIVWNFAVIDHLVMPPGEHRRGLRFGRFLLLNNTLTPLHLGMLHALVQLGGLHYLLANLLAVVAVFLLRYAVTSSWVYGAPAGSADAGRRLLHAVRRTVQTRLALALLLTSLAFPALLAIAWNGIWDRAATVPLIVPLAAAIALIGGRLRPDRTEPDVHDRQVDGLLATGFLGSATVLLLLMPESAPISWLVPAALAYLAGAAVLLVGTRTAARMRWALLLPVVALVSLPPAAAAANGALRWLVALLGQPAGPTADSRGLSTSYGGTELVLPEGRMPGPALLGAALCLVVCAFVLARPWRAVLGVAVLFAVSAASVLATLLIGRLFGPEAFRIAALPVVADLLLASAVAVLVSRWAGRPATDEPEPAPVPARLHLPRARFALAMLVVVAALLGLYGLPALQWQPAVAAVGSR